MKSCICVIALLLFFAQFADAQTLTPEGVIKKFEEAVATIDDYRCKLNEWCFNGSEYEKRSVDFYFLKPRNIRMEIIEGNRPFDPGSIVVFTGGNKIVGKKGGLFSFISATLDKKDPLVTSIRGTRIDEIDFIGILAKLTDRLANGINLVSVLPDGTYCLTGIDKKPLQNGSTYREVLYLDGATFFPKKMEGFEGTKQVVNAEWTDYVINAGLPPDLFSIDYSPDRPGKTVIKIRK
jgi:outer membrane lipoprotein-sorting protein